MQPKTFSLGTVARDGNLGGYSCAMLYLRALVLWSALIPLAIANGLLRDWLLVRWLGASAARAVSGVLLCGLIGAWTWQTIPWLAPRDGRACAVVGLGWLALTVGFEFGFGRLVAHRTWDELLRPYRFAGGDLWPVVLVVVTLAPWLAARARGLL